MPSTCVRLSMVGIVDHMNIYEPTNNPFIEATATLATKVPPNGESIHQESGMPSSLL